VAVPKGQRYGGKPKGYKHQKTMDKEAAREYVRRTVTAALAPLLAAQISNASGLKYLVTRDKKTGKFIRVTEAMAKVKQGDNEEHIEVWEKDPSVQAFTDLMNRALDKPQEQPFTVEHSASDELLARLDAIKRANREKL
jgi:hypothetical protein